MSCDIENHFENKTEIRNHNLKVNVKKIQYKNNPDNENLKLEDKELKEEEFAPQSDIKIERINSALFRMTRKNLKKNTNQDKKQLQQSNESDLFNLKMIKSNELTNEQKQFNCHHYHHHFSQTKSGTNEQNTQQHYHLEDENEDNCNISHHHHHHHLQEDEDELGTDESDEEDDGIEEIEDEGSYDDDQSTTTSTSTLHNLHNLRGSGGSNDDRSDKGNCCNCCYCEVFGHGLPSKATTSRNFEERRDQLRKKYNKRKQGKSTVETSKNGDELINEHNNQLNNPNFKDERDLDELLKFINNENGGTNCEKKNKKRKDKKKKKNKNDNLQSAQQVQVDNHENEVKLTNCDNTLVNEQQTNGQVDGCNMKLNNYQLDDDQQIIRANDKNTTKSNKKNQPTKKSIKFDKKNKKQQLKFENLSNLNGQQNQRHNFEKNSCKKPTNKDSLLDDVFLPKDIDYEDGVDEFEKELEEFKRFCLNSKPLPNKEKLNLDLKNIVIKKKSNSGSFNRKINQAL